MKSLWPRVAGSAIVLLSAVTTVYGLSGIAGSEPGEPTSTPPPREEPNPEYSEFPGSSIAPETPDRLINFGDIGRITVLFGQSCT
jgi:hypothetical protein